MPSKHHSGSSSCLGSSPAPAEGVPKNSELAASVDALLMYHREVLQECNGWDVLLSLEDLNRSREKVRIASCAVWGLVAPPALAQCGPNARLIVPESQPCPKHSNPLPPRRAATPTRLLVPPLQYPRVSSPVDVLGSPQPSQSAEKVASSELAVESVSPETCSSTPVASGRRLSVRPHRASRFKKLSDGRVGRLKCPSGEQRASSEAKFSSLKREGLKPSSLPPAACGPRHRKILAKDLVLHDSVRECAVFGDFCAKLSRPQTYA